jgi:hypothetical protein
MGQDFQKISTDSSATYMEPLHQVMAWWAFQKKFHIITPQCMLEPWIMAHNPWKKKNSPVL